jgi:hypothetical protein
MIVTDKLMQIETGEILNYFEVRAGAHSEFSSVGVMTQESYENSDPREFDSSGIASGGSVCFTGTGALLWNMAESEADNTQLSAPSHADRAVHAGDRVGILVDISVGTMAVLKNGQQVLLRKGLPVGQPMRCVRHNARAFLGPFLFAPVIPCARARAHGGVSRTDKMSCLLQPCSV